MEKTKIEWADSSWNVISGCYNDCEYCYARKTANRFRGCDIAPDGQTDEKVIALNERLTVTNKDGIARNAAYPYGFTPTFHEYRLNDPLTKGFGETIFVCSMGDMFGDWIPDEWIERVFEVCKQAQNHRYLFLTKNPKRYGKLAQSGKLPTGDMFWYGSTATTPTAPVFYSDKHRTFVSIEPLLEKFGPVDFPFSNLTDWVILGAETGNRKKKVVPEKAWVANIVESLRKCDIPIFMKDSMKSIWGPDIITEFPWSK